MKEIDLSKEAKVCGGVLAALVSTLRKINFGEQVKVFVNNENIREFEEALALLTKYGLVKIVNKISNNSVIIEKSREE